jgi:hypothetical protein
MYGYFSIQSIAVDAEHFGGTALVSMGLGQRGLNEFLFKRADGFIEKDSFFNHLGNKQLQFLFHGLPLSGVFAPPPLNRVISIRETRFEIARRSKSNNPGTRQEVGRQSGTLHSLGLKIKRSQRQKDDRTKDPTSYKSECSSKDSIEPLDLGKLYELPHDPDDGGADEQGSQKNNGEAQE